MSVRMTSQKSVGTSIFNECGHGTSDVGTDVTEKCQYECIWQDQSRKSTDGVMINNRTCVFCERKESNSG